MCVGGECVRPIQHCNILIFMYHNWKIRTVSKGTMWTSYFSSPGSEKVGSVLPWNKTTWGSFHIMILCHSIWMTLPFSSKTSNSRDSEVCRCRCWSRVRTVRHETSSAKREKTSSVLLRRSFRITFVFFLTCVPIKKCWLCHCDEEGKGFLIHDGSF